MNVGKILGVGASAGTLVAGAFVHKLQSSFGEYYEGTYDEGYCVDDAYHNNPAISGGTWRRVPPRDESDYQHDVFVPIKKQEYYVPS